MGWRAAVAANELSARPPGEIVGALRAMFLDGNQSWSAHRPRASPTGSPPACAPSGTGHVNDGEDIVDRAHGAPMTAIALAYDDRATEVVVGALWVFTSAMRGGAAAWGAGAS